MQIVVLDGYALNPGDLDWAPLQALGACTVFDRTPPAEIITRAREAEIVLTNKTVLDRSVIEQLPNLRYIGVLATGVNVVDLVAARERGIAVTNAPGYSTPAVAQMVFALLLELTSQAGHHGRLVREGRWSAAADFCFWDRPLVELAGRTLGLVGFGQIGRQVARIARAFDMRVLVHTAHPEKYAGDPSATEVAFVGLDSVFTDSDVVSLHCPLTPATEQLVDARRLAMMRPGALLINTGRGPLIDEPALAAALTAGQLGGAGLDVLSVEPPPANHPLLQAPGCLITPHIAWAARAARERLLQIVVANLQGFLSGKPHNVVN